MNNPHLHIIIPYHGENRELYYPLLQNINSQQNFDFNNLSIYIGRSDGEQDMPDFSGLSNIEDKVTYISKSCKVSGPGQSRQVCADYIVNTYYKDKKCGLDGILYFDCDDTITTNIALSKLLIFMIYNPNYTVLKCKSYQYIDDKIKDLEPDAELHNVWGKVYRAQVIKDYHIKFPADIKANEDYVYNYCVYSVPDMKLFNFDFSFYQWNRRNTSTSSQGSFCWNLDKSVYYIEEAFEIQKYYSNWRKKYAPNSTDSGFNYMRGYYHIVYQVNQAERLGIELPQELKDRIKPIYKEYMEVLDRISKVEYNFDFLRNSVENWLQKNS